MCTYRYLTYILYINLISDLIDNISNLQVNQDVFKLISNGFYILLVKYMYSPVVLACHVAMVQVGDIRTLVCYLHEPAALGHVPQYVDIEELWSRTRSVV